MQKLVGNGKQYIIKAVNVGATGTDSNLTKGKEYTTLHGIEEGMLDTPYVSCICDDNKAHSFYVTRFEIIKEVE